MGEPVEEFQYEISETIRQHALSLPETDEGTSCVNRAFKAGGKNFAFLGEKDGECNIRLKLADSVPEIETLSAQDADRWQVGKAGWTMLRFSPDEPPAAVDLERWITESFRLLAPKKIARLLDE